MPPNPKDRLKLDQLAVDPAGNLVLLELKDTSGSSSEVYYAPFQLLPKCLGVAPGAERGAAFLAGSARCAREAGADAGTRAASHGWTPAAVGFGNDRRSPEVRDRYLEVLNIAKAYLPPGIPPIETWALEHEQPVRLK